MSATRPPVSRDQHSWHCSIPRRVMRMLLGAFTLFQEHPPCSMIEGAILHRAAWGLRPFRAPASPHSHARRRLPSMLHLVVGSNPLPPPQGRFARGADPDFRWLDLMPFGLHK